MISNLLYFYFTDEAINPLRDSETSSRSNSSPKNSNLSKKQELEFQENLLKKDGQLTEMDRVVKSLEEEMKRLRMEVNARRESEEQMKQVLKEYEKTISELIAEKEKEREKFEFEKSKLEEERDQAAQDLQNVEAAFADVHRKVSYKLRISQQQLKHSRRNRSMMMSNFSIFFYLTV